MKQFTISILVFIVCSTTYGQVKVNPNGEFFNYNGTKIYYEDTGSGEPLLLLHNFFNTADSWKPHVEAYSKQFRTIAVDMMGHGRSDIYNIVPNGGHLPHLEPEIQPEFLRVSLEFLSGKWDGNS